MNLNNPDTRRALRNVLLTIISLALLYFVWDALGRLKQEASLLELSRDCLIIIGLFVLGTIAENVGRVSVDFIGAKASMGADSTGPGDV